MLMERKIETQASWRRLRLVPLAIGALAMVFGLWTGLTRLGVVLPGGMPRIAELHGALMISGFLGTLISLERAVALGRWWGYAAPFLSSLGAVALLVGMPHIAALTFVSAGGFLAVASASFLVRQPALFTIVLAAGAVCWGIGSGQWLIGDSMPAVAGWWLSFLILTIAAERLELSRIVSPPPSSQVMFAAAALLLLIGSARGELAQISAPFTAAGLLGCAAWLLHHDLARRTIRLAGLPRFSAVCILAGHAWLAVAGILILLAPPGATAFSYDAAVHAIAIGFVLSMVLGHAPIILPAVLGARVRYTSFAYVPVALLHASVLLRIGSDMLERLDLRTGSGMVTVLALVSYAATFMLASRRAARRRTV
jgi:hypothetical protein